jgi:methionyl-tRNA formyltransferase
LKKIKIILFFNNNRGIKVLNYLLKKKTIDIKKIILSEKNLNKKIIKEINKKKISYKVVSNKNMHRNLKLFQDNIDLFLLCGFPYIIRKNLYNLPKFGTLNLHAGPLPHYKGGSPLNWQIINGEKKIGLSVIKINNKIDDGPLLKQKFFKIKRDHNIKDVHKIANSIFPKILYESIIKIINKKKPFIKKNNKSPKYFKQRTKEDGKINWKKFDNIKVYNLIRAITKPYHGAFSYNTKGKKITFYKASIDQKKFSNLKPGQVFFSKKKIFIGTSNGEVKIEKKSGKMKNLEILK